MGHRNLMFAWKFPLQNPLNPPTLKLQNNFFREIFCRHLSNYQPKFRNMTSTSSRLMLSLTSRSSLKAIGGNRTKTLSNCYQSLRSLSVLPSPSQGTAYRNILNRCLTGSFLPPRRTLTCWKCETELEEKSEYSLLVCSNPKCRSLQKLRGTNIPNYYDLLGHPKSYRVDVGSLSSRVKNLQKKLHPDLYAQKGKEEQELSQELSSLVNKAFGTLSHPIERGRYLLKLHGIEDPEGDSEKELTNDPEFLEEVMELNEKLVEIKSEKSWMDFRRQNDISLQELATKLEDAFEGERIQDAKILIGRMKYYDTLQRKLKEVRSRLGIVE